MTIKNQTLKDHLIPILSVLSILSMLLPFLKYTADEESDTLSVFDLINGDYGTWIAVLLIIFPALIIMSNYIKPLHKYKKVISVAIPVVAVIFEIIGYCKLKGAIAEAVDGDYSLGFGYYYSVETTFKPQIGFFLIFLCYIAIAVVGLMLYKGLTLDKAGLESLKENSKNVISKAAVKVSTVVGKEETATSDSQTNTTAEKPVEKPTEKVAEKPAEKVVEPKPTETKSE